MRLTPRSFVMRVALTTALSAIGASAAVALISQLVADNMARAREDTTLGDVAETFALELRAPHSDPHWIAEDEAREFRHANIHVAVFAGRTFVAGDARLRQVPPSTCRDAGSLRTCARAAGLWLAVVARDQAPLRDQRQLRAYASIIAVLFTSVLGALSALAIARVVARPLATLRSAVERVPAADPGAAELGPSAGLVEIDALRESLHDAFVRLGAAMMTSRRFASDAAHELRTPLTTLLGELDLVAEAATATDREGLERARRVAQRMNTLVDRLLILARVDALRDVEPVEVTELMEDALETLPPPLRARIGLPARPAHASVMGDRALLLACLTNALDNALKFSDGPVRIELDVTSSQAVLAVIDTGPGLDERERERVFAPFYRTAASRASAVRGHGIGLALIAHVMSLHAGSARFVAQPRGARLELALPAMQTV